MSHVNPVVLYVGQPTIVCHETSKAVTPGSLVSFVCKVHAYPEPVSISWNGSRERTNVSNVGKRNTYYAFKDIVNAWDSTLSFKDFVEVDDSGMYTITARNEHGVSSMTVELQVLREFIGHACIRTYIEYIHTYVHTIHTYVHTIHAYVHTYNTYGVHTCRVCTVQILALYNIICTIYDHTYFILGMNFASSMPFTKYEYHKYINFERSVILRSTMKKKTICSR